mmetsp:Transcript_12079/g.15916  ORF Transcript_12079/g.15916 Transcript_12079/m.15916 type:complete len:108 (-) Transcript_12079:279-602(-)
MTEHNRYNRRRDKSMGRKKVIYSSRFFDHSVFSANSKANSKLYDWLVPILLLRPAQTYAALCYIFYFFHIHSLNMNGAVNNRACTLKSDLCTQRSKVGGLAPVFFVL